MAVLAAAARGHGTRDGGARADDAGEQAAERARSQLLADVLPDGPKRCFVDVHTHVVPSGDDGAATIEEGLTLCAEAVATGTRIVYATPHMHGPGDQYPWTDERAARFAEAFAAMRPVAARMGLVLRRGREVYPSEVFQGELDDLRLEGTKAVLVEFPGGWLDVPDAVELTWRACEQVAAEGLTPVMAHPERCPAVVADLERLRRFTDRGWLVCLNSQSLLGEHGPDALATAVRLLDQGMVSLVASDAHRPSRPPRLDLAEQLIAARYGAAAALALLDGRALPWETSGKGTAPTEPLLVEAVGAPRRVS